MRETNQNLKILTLALSLALPLSSQAAITRGVGSSGGGSAIVCRDANQAITRAQMYDLYEGQNYFGYTIPTSADTPRNQLLQAVHRLNANDYVAPVVTQTLNVIISKMEFLPDGMVLSAPTDMGTDYPVIHPVGCNVEGIGFYTSAGQLKISKGVYDAFSNTDKAAFVLHEALYFAERELSDAENSELARNLTSALFATGTTDAEIADLSNVVIDQDWYRPGDYILLNGATTSDMTIEVSTTDPRGTGFSLENIRCATTPRMQSFTYPDAQTTTSGTVSVQLADEPCFDLIGDIKLTTSFSPLDPVTYHELPRVEYTVKVFHQGALVQTLEGSVGNGFSGAFFFKIAHPDLPLANLP